jgi:hypothetical protein
MILAAALAAAAHSAIWPEHLGPYDRKSAQTATSNEAAPEEDGFVAAEQADYGRFQVTAAQYKDPTGAYAAAIERPSKPLQVGNYVISCSGDCPKELAKLADAALPRVSRAALPILPDYLPSKDRVSHSERYILGPIGLKTVAPSIPESLAAFQFSPEAAVARYRLRTGDELLAIFSYPTPQIARDQAVAFEKAAIGLVKRTGPFVAVIPAPPDAQAAQKLLANINYQAAVSWNEPIPIPVKPQSVAQMILAIIELAGIVVAFCVLSGLAFGSYRILSRRFGHSGAGDAMILLDLRDK